MTTIMPIRKSVNNSFKMLWGMSLIFIVLWMLFYPPYLSTNDEYRYLMQAKAFSEASLSINRLNLTTWTDVSYIPMTSPPGTSSLLTPFLLMPEWKIAFLMPLISQVLVTFLIARILYEEGQNPLFSIFFMTCPVAIAFGRMVMSDMPNMAFLIGSLALFWIGARDKSKALMLFWAGALAGLSLLFRHTNVLILIPFFIIHVLKRKAGSIHLIIGGVFGCLPRFIYYWQVWGSPLYFESNPQGFGFSRFAEHIVFYGLSLNFVLPGLPLIVAFYKGRYRVELFTACLLYFFVYCYFEGGAHATSYSKRLILANRYMLPIIPLLIWAAAEPLTRWLSRISDSCRKVLVTIILILIIPYWFWILSAQFLWMKERSIVRKMIYDSTSAGSLILHNSENVRKYLLPLGKESRFQYAWWEVEGNDILSALNHKMQVFTVFIYREDRGWFNECVEEYVSNLDAVCDKRPIMEETIVGDETLNIFQIQRCWAPLKPHPREQCYSATPPASWDPG